MASLYTNRIDKQDIISTALASYVEDGMEIFIASAFLTETSIIEDMLSKNCRLKVIVRLGYPTSPQALKTLLNQNNVDVRFYTSHSFHPKLYIFGDKNLLLGSANLTRAAVTSNQEIVVDMSSEDPRFDELQSLFFDYWEEASVLTGSVLKNYQAIYNQNRQIYQLEKQFEHQIIDTFGETSFSNINRGKKKQSKQALYLDSYQKSYQETVSAFELIQGTYKNIGRKVAPELIPQRLEIDSFFSFVRDCHATGDTWEKPNIGWDSAQKEKLKTLVAEWLQTDWPYFEKTIVNDNYPRITNVFSSPQSIQAATDDELVDGLTVLHSFYECLRFHKGGLETLKRTFKEDNDLQHVRKSLSYLLFGTGDIVTRMSNLIFNDDYKINLFGRANVQELVGWISKEELPVINGRTTKVLRYLGFNVRQL